MNLTKIVQLLLIYALLVSCDKDDDVSTDIPFNRLTMEINGIEWAPSMPLGDSCRATLDCFEGMFSGDGDERTFYEVRAFKDEHNYEDYRADNQFELQITDVTGIGKYLLSNTYKNYINYAFLITRDSEGIKKYVSSVSSPFEFEVEDMIPTKYTFTGIRGKFSGVLFNEDNPEDSITITNGRFRFTNGNGLEICND